MAHPGADQFVEVITMPQTEHSHLIDLVEDFIFSRPLSEDICASIAAGLASPAFHHVAGDTSEWQVFKRSYDQAVRDIVSHPRGELFKRLIEFGPLLPSEPEDQSANRQTYLSDPEWGECVEFIFSHMINRFKGELAELLAIKPCLELMDNLREHGRLPGPMRLYWGDTVQEYRQRKHGEKSSAPVLAKGADGLMVSHGDGSEGPSVRVHGIVEIKSMAVSRKKMLAQIERHSQRLGEGVRLDTDNFAAGRVEVDQHGMIRIMVVPSNWCLSREVHMEETEPGVHTMVFPKPQKPALENKVEELEPGQFRITMDWSKEALEQAAYEMTYHYMALVGERVFSKPEYAEKPQGEDPADAGYNAIKEMLYAMPLRGRYNPKRKARLAVRLYNVYSFGYPIGIDSREMLWPDDIHMSK